MTEYEVDEYPDFQSGAESLRSGSGFKSRPSCQFKKENMKDKTPICRKCKKQCKKQVDANPTWFAKYHKDNLVEAICIDCWNKGEKWKNSSLKNKASIV